jgi:hypothetical protein
VGRLWCCAPSELALISTTLLPQVRDTLTSVTVFASQHLLTASQFAACAHVAEITSHPVLVAASWHIRQLETLGNQALVAGFKYFYPHSRDLRVMLTARLRASPLVACEGGRPHIPRDALVDMSVGCSHLSLLFDGDDKNSVFGILRHVVGVCVEEALSHLRVNVGLRQARARRQARATHTHTHIHVHTHAHTHTHIRAHTRTHAHTHTCTHAHTRIHTFEHTHHTRTPHSSHKHTRHTHIHTSPTYITPTPTHSCSSPSSCRLACPSSASSSAACVLPLTCTRSERAQRAQRAQRVQKATCRYAKCATATTSATADY